MLIKRRYTKHPNFRLWVALAMVPVVILFGVLCYIVYAFDDGYILETDPTGGQDQLAVVNNYEHEFENATNPLEAHRQSQKSSSILDTHGKKSQKQESQKMEEIKIVEKRKIDKYGKPVQVRVQEGETLESMSERYLGHKVFWAYLYDINEDKIVEARGVKQGMALYLPDTAYYFIHPDDARSLRDAMESVRKLKPDAFPEPTGE